LDSGVVQDPDAGRREVGADEHLVAVQLRAQVRQHRLGAEVLTCMHCVQQVRRRTQTTILFVPEQCSLEYSLDSTQSILY
jgi:hypothetical protein